MTHRLYDCKRGSALSQAKLNETLVKRIREEHQEKQRKVKELHEAHGAKALAKRYGVSERAIDKVLCYQTWRHVL